MTLQVDSNAPVGTTLDWYKGIFAFEERRVEGKGAFVQYEEILRLTQRARIYLGEKQCEPTLTDYGKRFRGTAFYVNAWKLMQAALDKSMASPTSGTWSALLDAVEMPADAKQPSYPEPLLAQLKWLEDGRYQWRQFFSTATDPAEALEDIKSQWEVVVEKYKEIHSQQQLTQKSKVMFLKRDTVARLGEKYELNPHGSKQSFKGRLRVEGSLYTFTEDDTGLSTQCSIPEGNAQYNASRIDAMLHKGMLAERRQAK